MGSDETLIELVTASEEHIRKIEAEKKAAQERELELIRERLEQEKIATEQEKKARQAAQTRTKFAISAAVLAVVALIAVVFGWREQQRTERLMENLVFRTEVVEREAIDDLDLFFNKGNDSINAARKSQKSQDYERGIGYYRAIVIFANRLQRQRNYQGQFSKEEKTKIQNNYDKATNNLLKIMFVDRYRLKKIETELQKGNIGKHKGSGFNSSDLEEQFEPGALQETYKAIMFDTVADLNENGIINPEKEVKRIPPELLKEIEMLWIKYAGNSCGWLGNKKWDFAEDCVKLSQRPLAVVLFNPISYTKFSNVLITYKISNYHLLKTGD